MVGRKSLCLPAGLVIIFSGLISPGVKAANFPVVDPNGNETADSLSCPSFKGEVPVGAVKEDNGGGASVCSEFTVRLQKLDSAAAAIQSGARIEADGSVISLVEKKILTESDVDLNDCAQKAINLAKSLKEGSFKSEALNPPIRESFSANSWKFASSIKYYRSRGTIEGKNNEFYYFNDQYPYYDYLSGNAFTDYSSSKAYSGNNICRIYIDRNYYRLVGYDLRAKPVGKAEGSNWQAADQTIVRCASVPTKMACNHKDAYDYDFSLETNRGQAETSLCQGKFYKCDEVRLKFSARAEWSAGLIKGPAATRITYSRDSMASSPTATLPCLDQADCLDKAEKVQLTSDSWAKGIQKVPVNFIETTEKSLSSNDPAIDCKEGVCVARAAGQYQLNATAPESTYYGQCGSSGEILEMPEALIPSVAGNLRINVQNRPPAATVSFSQNQVNPGSEITATCDIVDPDECADKITKIKWQCYDSAGRSTGCFFNDNRLENGNNGNLSQEGSYLMNVSVDRQTNPYRATVGFKATRTGNYAVTCEAWDSDSRVPLSGFGLNAMSACLGGNCGVQATDDLKFCSVIRDPAENLSPTRCGTEGKFRFVAYTAGINPAVYKWRCGGGGGGTENSADPVKDCEYGVGSFLPSLTIIDKEGKAIECVTQTSATVTGENKCWLEARKAGTNDEYSKQSLTIAAGEEVEVRAKRQCVNGGDIKWEAVNGLVTGSGGENAKVKFNISGEGSIKAGITQNGQTTDCGYLRFTVKDNLRVR